MVLFVCTGNTCRSPMAELYFNELARRAGCLETCRAASAGLAAWSGDTISAGARAVLAEQNIDCTEFRSHRFSPYLAEEAQYIVPMTGSHRAGVLALMPEAAAKTRLLLDWGAGGDVPDPFGGDVSVYREVFARMRPALEQLFHTML